LSVSLDQTQDNHEPVCVSESQFEKLLILVIRYFFDVIWYFVDGCQLFVFRITLLFTQCLLLREFICWLMTPRIARHCFRFI